MLARTPEDFLAMTGTDGALLGLDPGTKTIGVAISDEGRGHASPLETIARSKLTEDMERLRAVIEERDVKGIVLGMPVNMDGSAGPRAQSVRAFSRSIEQALGLPVLQWDERLSSVAAEEAMIATGMNRKARAERIDAMAAAEILRGALERLAMPTIPT
jgi:putative Holliday junction resolvase